MHIKRGLYLGVLLPHERLASEVDVLKERRQLDKGGARNGGEKGHTSQHAILDQVVALEHMRLEVLPQLARRLVLLHRGGTDTGQLRAICMYIRLDQALDWRAYHC